MAPQKREAFSYLAHAHCETLEAIVTRALNRLREYTRHAVNRSSDDLCGAIDRPRDDISCAKPFRKPFLESESELLFVLPSLSW
jgi:hypothetical protein